MISKYYKISNFELIIIYLSSVFLILLFLFINVIYKTRKDEKEKLKRQKMKNQLQAYEVDNIIQKDNLIDDSLPLKTNKKIEFMNQNKSGNIPEIIDQYILNMDRNNPIYLNELIELLGKWQRESKAKTIGNVNGYGRMPLLWITINGRLYKINTDTKRKGIEIFLENQNKNHQLKIIRNKVGNFNLVTNDSEGRSISGLYFYAENPRNGVELI